MWGQQEARTRLRMPIVGRRPVHIPAGVSRCRPGLQPLIVDCSRRAAGPSPSGHTAYLAVVGAVSQGTVGDPVQHMLRPLDLLPPAPGIHQACRWEGAAAMWIIGQRLGCTAGSLHSGAGWNPRVLGSWRPEGQMVGFGCSTGSWMLGCAVIRRNLPGSGQGIGAGGVRRVGDDQRLASCPCPSSAASLGSRHTRYRSCA